MASYRQEIDGVTNASKVTPSIPHQKNDKRKSTNIIEDMVSTVTFEALVVIRSHPAPELPDILKECGIVLPKFLCRAIMIIVGLIVLFKYATSQVIPNDASRARATKNGHTLHCKILPKIGRASRKMGKIKRTSLIIPRRRRRDIESPQFF
ncbi:hypothetical protein IEQ34_022000 [Dendrobium chrysotoxum]|uniref:Uncharacterized protein n=1 Tax=Dendrobium chrysotoxum TaxID=161865 RepID=A0AAV7FJY6_DENCH|nr:hypothetical protein IEQ34_022000 [Dendrobium chrysotoxum]